MQSQMFDNPLLRCSAWVHADDMNITATCQVEFAPPEEDAGWDEEDDDAEWASRRMAVGAARLPLAPNSFIFLKLKRGDYASVCLVGLLGSELRIADWICWGCTSPHGLDLRHWMDHVGHHDCFYFPLLIKRRIQSSNEVCQSRVSSISTRQSTAVLLWIKPTRHVDTSAWPFPASLTQLCLRIVDYYGVNEFFFANRKSSLWKFLTCASESVRCCFEFTIIMVV